MGKLESFGIGIVALVLLAGLVTLPVSAAAVGTESVSAAVKQSVNATVSAGRTAVGEPVTISGTVSGSMISAGVQIWVFAGNYVNVSTVPVNADGTFSKTYNSIGLPPATYYVFVQSPGPNGKYNIDFQESGIYSGQVVNTETNALVFNFTGTGSVRDAAAAQSLSDAINNQGVDDAYTKLTFQLVPSIGSQPSEQTTAAVPAATTTAKSPIPLEISGFALVIGGICAVMLSRKVS
jgi:hypothetical protein